MREAVIVEALRNPFAKERPIKGDPTGFHSTQPGEQAGNVARHAWLSRGKDTL